MLKKLTTKARKFLATAKRNRYVQASVLSIPGLAGIAVISLGVSLVYLPAGLVVLGLLLFRVDARL